MNVVLIHCETVTTSLEVGLLAACLRRAGHRTRVIYLPKSCAKRDGQLRFNLCFPDALLDQVRDLCSDAQLVGISLMTHEFLLVSHLTRALKERGVAAPVIWGGIQPTVEPEECLHFADIICVGEGEGALVELADRIEAGQSYLDVQNLWVNTPDGIVRNPLRPLIQDLDSLPIPDYTFEDQYQAVGQTLQPMTAELYLADALKTRYLKTKGFTYRVLTSRGCPYSCAFCCNSAFAKLYEHHHRIRWRSISHVSTEIEAVKKHVGPVNRVLLLDDNFAARPAAELRAVCQEYKVRIGLPFTLQLSPATVDPERLNILIDAGLDKPKLGVQTASTEIAKLYHREQLFQRTQRAVALLEQYRHRYPLPPSYHFIIDNPYESLEQELKTFYFALSLSRPWHSQFFSLIFFPGTELYEKAMNDGLIKDKSRMIYTRDFFTSPRPYLKLWVRLYSAQAPRWLLKALLAPWLTRFMTMPAINALLRSSVAQTLWERSFRK